MMYLVTPSRVRIEALFRLGLRRSHLRKAYQGKPIAFNRQIEQGRPIICVLKVETALFRCGIMLIRDTSGNAPLELARFRNDVFHATQVFDLEWAEIFGMEFINSKFQAMLIRRGFEPAQMEIPEALGGGTAQIYGKRYQIARMEQQ